jgi:hypothetical protein
MKFKDLPVVFLSYKEDNADANFEDLKTMVPNALRVHGVKGFDSAHKAAMKLARQYTMGRGIDPTRWPYFITVDADNRTFSNFWGLDTEAMDKHIYDRDNRPPQGRSVLSWNAYNPMTGLVYGNGGLKLWGFQFVEEMTTHEASSSDLVDFCWNQGYTQMAAIFGETITNGSARQAFTAGFREGIKMPLTNGQMDFDALYDVKNKSYPSNLERLICWCCLGAHAKHGRWSMLGALRGFLECHVHGTFKLSDVSIIEKIHSSFGEWDEDIGHYDDTSFDAELAKFRAIITRKTDIFFPTFGPKQSEFVVRHSRPSLTHKPFELESWPQRLEPKQY